MPAKKAAIVSVDRVEKRIYQIRGQRVILSSDLAVLYGVPARVLNQAVTRNLERFPDDFMFQLTPHEFGILKSQIVTSSWGGARRARPYAFTEQGVAMLSAVLRSPTAIRVSIEIVRAFVRLRQLLTSHQDLRRKLESLEGKMLEHDEKFAVVFDAIRQLMQPPEPVPEPEDPPKPPIGFQTELAPRSLAKRKSALKSKI